jgi:hypothetical protein
MGVAVFVELEQFRSQRFAAGVSLALVLIDVNSQLSRHDLRSPWVHTRWWRSRFLFTFVVLASWRRL